MVVMLLLSRRWCMDVGCGGFGEEVVDGVDGKLALGIVEVRGGFDVVVAYVWGDVSEGKREG